MENQYRKSLLRFLFVNYYTTYFLKNIEYIKTIAHPYSPYRIFQEVIFMIKFTQLFHFFSAFQFLIFDKLEGRKGFTGKR